MRLPILIFILLLPGLAGLAQERTYIRAQLLTSDSLLPMANAHVISKQMRRGTISNPEGFFRISTAVDDSLLLTSLGFQRRIVRITEEMWRSETPPLILMDKDTIKMQEVVVRSFYDWPTFKYIFVNMKPIKPVEIAWLNEEMERSLVEIRQQPASMKGPIQAMYDLFHQAARIQRRLERNRRLYNDQVIREGRYWDTIPALPPHLRDFD